MSNPNITVSNKSAAAFRARQRAASLAEFRATLDSNSDAMSRCVRFVTSHKVEFLAGPALGLLCFALATCLGA